MNYEAMWNSFKAQLVGEGKEVIDTMKYLSFKEECKKDFEEAQLKISLISKLHSRMTAMFDEEWKKS